MVMQTFFNASVLSLNKKKTKNTNMVISKRIAFALFALLLGGIGAHKFYIKENVWGVIYLLFCWTYIPAILGIIEGIMALCKTDEESCEIHGIRSNE